MLPRILPALVAAMFTLTPACASLPSQPPTTAASGPATVIGHVVSDRGAILTDADVRLNASSVHRETRTDISGGFTFGGVPLGRYTLSASAVGYKGVKKHVSIEQEGSVNVTLTLTM